MSIILVGGGNITQSRHIPALRRLGKSVLAVVGVNADHVAAAQNASRARYSLIVDPSRSFAQQLTAAHWHRNATAAIIGTPPQTHFRLASDTLEAGLHVLLEKPMTTSTTDAVRLQDIARKSSLILSVMHNFQFARGVQALEAAIKAGRIGHVRSFHLSQNTSRARRLPTWYKDLPLGLFFDECAHFFYMARRLGGPLRVLASNAEFNADPADRTPHLVSAMFRAGNTPSTLNIDFNSAVCEWFFMVSGTKAVAIYDYIRDILIILPADRSHYALDILRTSAAALGGHAVGFVSSGFRMLTGGLLYGVDDVIRQFLYSIDGQPSDEGISAERGVETVTAMEQVVAQIGAR